MTILRALALIALQSVLVVVLGWGVLAPRLVPDPEAPWAPSAGAALLVVMLGLIGAVGLVYFGSLRATGRSWQSLGWRTDRLGAQIGAGALGALACVLVVLGVYRVMGVPLSEVLERLRSYSLAERAMFLLIGIQAAFVEESLFRGNLLPALAARFGNKAALPLSAVVFALYHLNPRPLSLVVKTLLGLIFGGLRLQQGSLVAPAVAHALFWVLVGTL
jgi:membrane protease YdiL (CAAX protease family)